MDKLLTAGVTVLDGAVGDCLTTSDWFTSAAAGFSSTVGVGILTSSRLSPPGGGGSLGSSMNSSSTAGEATISSLNSSSWRIPGTDRIKTPFHQRQRCLIN